MEVKSETSWFIAVEIYRHFTPVWPTLVSMYMYVFDFGLFETLIQREKF